MKDIDEIIFGYAGAVIGLKRVIREKAKGDWSKLAILVKNDEEARQLDEKRSYYEGEFRESTVLGNLYTCSKGVMKAISDFLLEEDQSEQAAKTSLEWDIEAARDAIADMLQDEEDYRVVALDSLARLPNFSPDDWVRRKYMIDGIYLGEGTEVPSHLIQRIEEACYSFIYGNFLSCVAMSRAAIETALKEKYPDFTKRKLNDILKTRWLETEGLKEYPEVQKRAISIQEAGNQILHDRKTKVVNMWNEFFAQSVLQNMREVIQFLYQ